MVFIRRYLQTVRCHIHHTKCTLARFVVLNIITDFKKKVKVKVKCTLVQALRLCTGRTAHRGSRGVALLLHDHGTRRG